MSFYTFVILKTNTRVLAVYNANIQMGTQNTDILNNRKIIDLLDSVEKLDFILSL